MELAVASLAAVPLLLFVAVVLLLLTSRASGRLLNNFLVVLALFAGLLPLAMLSIAEWWSLLLFGLLLSGLVGYVLTPHDEEPSAAASRRRRSAAILGLTPYSFQESLQEMQFWAEQVRTKTDDLRRKVRELYGG